MTIINYTDEIPEQEQHVIDPDTGEVKRVWVEAWQGRFAVLRNSEAVSLKHERADEDIPFILNQRDWKPLEDIEGYQEVNNLL